MPDQPRPCSYAGPEGPCPELVTKASPCPKHGRPVNAPWSTDRDKNAHERLRRLVIKQRGAKCERCDWQTTPDGKGLEMHHTRPGDRPENVVLLCGSDANGCHKTVDRHAR